MAVSFHSIQMKGQKTWYHIILSILFLLRSNFVNGAGFSLIFMQRRHFCLEHAREGLRTRIECAGWCLRRMSNKECPAFYFDDYVEPKRCECGAVFCENQSDPDNDTILALHGNNQCPFRKLISSIKVF